MRKVKQPVASKLGWGDMVEVDVYGFIMYVDSYEFHDFGLNPKLFGSECLIHL